MMSKDTQKGNPFFILSVIILLLPLIVPVLLRYNSNYFEVRNYIRPLYIALTICQIVFPFAALILSFAGLLTARKRGKGVIRCTVCLVIAFVQVVLMLLWFLLVVPYLSRAYTTPPDYTIQAHNSNIESVREEIERAMKESPKKSSQRD